MDGNRRWAKKQGLPAVAGHKKVVEERIEELIEKAAEMGVEYITFWAFSTENWGRSCSLLGIQYQLGTRCFDASYVWPAQRVPGQTLVRVAGLELWPGQKLHMEMPAAAVVRFECDDTVITERSRENRYSRANMSA